MTLAVVAVVHLCVYLTHSHIDKLSEAEQLIMLPELEEAFIQYVDSVKMEERAKRYAQYASPRPEIILQPFDPNTADSALLVSVGLKPYMAKNLIRYRRAGKTFRRPDDLRKLYGMTDSLYATLEPYIQIDTSLYRTIVEPLSNRYRTVNGANTGFDTVYAPSVTVKRDTILELNSADTTELQMIRGIGRYTAMLIVKRRNELGGYYSLDQLYEIREIPVDRLDSLLPHFTVDTMRINPINVNKASVKRLYRHPYISYRQAENLYDLRRRNIQLHSIDELSDIFTDDERLRLTPYLRFDR